MLLTPLGVETDPSLISNALPGIGTGERQRSIEIQVALRELLGITGISQNRSLRRRGFTWRWVSINAGGRSTLRQRSTYRSTVGFRGYDDGWRVVEQAIPANQPLEESLRNAQPAAP